METKRTETHEMYRTASPRHFLNVVLVEPEIPPNTGNIARLCGATGSTLHLVHPLGFRTDDRNLKRAGLDYWPHITVRHHPNLKAFLSENAGSDLLFFSTRGRRVYTDAPYSPGCFLVFGKETTGLPHDLLEQNMERCFEIPIWGNVRSLNLSTAVGVVVYEAYRQLGVFTP
jgi:tRNA (cytidine/uridine-2'-O-)-methyltransferase